MEEITLKNLNPETSDIIYKFLNDISAVFYTDENIFRIKTQLLSSTTYYDKTTKMIIKRND